MTVDELRSRLLLLPVPEDAYSLCEGTRDESWVMEYTGSEWLVFYAERGQRTDERRFGSEGDACSDMLRRLTSAFVRD